jgi:hypothetical protein
VADALVGVDQRGLAAQDLEHIALGTGGDATAAPDAPVDVDVGVLGLGTAPGLEPCPARSLAARGLAPPVPAPLCPERNRQQQGKREVERCFQLRLDYEESFAISRTVCAHAATIHRFVIA